VFPVSDCRQFTKTNVIAGIKKKVPGIQNKAGVMCCRKQDLHKSRQLDRLCTSKYDLQPVNHTTWPGGGIIQDGIGLFFKTFSRSIDQSVTFYGGLSNKDYCKVQ